MDHPHWSSCHSSPVLVHVGSRFRPRWVSGHCRAVPRPFSEKKNLGRGGMLDEFLWSLNRTWETFFLKKSPNYPKMKIIDSKVRLGWDMFSSPDGIFLVGYVAVIPVVGHKTKLPEIKPSAWWKWLRILGRTNKKKPEKSKVLQGKLSLSKHGR